MSEADGDIGLCAMRIAAERHRLLERCLDRNSTEAPRVVIRACTEAIEDGILERRDQAYEFVNRADAYFKPGYAKAALDDYNRAIKLSPHTAAPGCNISVRS
jgi:tetratricopeptide (TPR) repeat protein